MTTDDGKRGLDSKGFGRRVFWVVVVICAALICADFFYHKHVHFWFEERWGFFGWFGFIACFFLVLAARGMRAFVMRSKDYYDRDDR